jgi:hypothetical protein
MTYVVYMYSINYSILEHLHVHEYNCYHRFRVCQLVAKMMSYAADAQTKIGPDRLDRVQEVMMQRLYDKVSQY